MEDYLAHALLHSEEASIVMRKVIAGRNDKFEYYYTSGDCSDNYIVSIAEEATPIARIAVVLNEMMRLNSYRIKIVNCKGQAQYVRIEKNTRLDMGTQILNQTRSYTWTPEIVVKHL